MTLRHYCFYDKIRKKYKLRQMHLPLHVTYSKYFIINAIVTAFFIYTGVTVNKYFPEKSTPQ